MLAHQFTAALTGSAVFCFALFGQYHFAPGFETSFTASAFANESGAISALRKGDFNGAASQAGENKALQSFVEWRYLTDSSVTPDFKRAVTFAVRHPGWPQMHIIREKAEKAAGSHFNRQEILTYYDANPPISLEGKILYTQLMKNAKRVTEANALIKTIWHGEKFNFPENEQRFLTENRNILTQDDHRKRLNFLFHEQRIGDAERLLSYLTPADRSKFSVRAALVRLQSQALAQYNNLSKDLRDDPDILRDLTYFYRKRNEDGKAVQILANLTPAQSQNDPEFWADHRLAMVRLALRDFGANIAYKVVANHMITKNAADFADAEWTAGWISLRKLNRPADAERHFQRLIEKVSTPVSLARGHYWRGRALDALGRKPEALIAYDKAAQFPYVFYGQLATEKLGKKISIPATRVTQADRNSFNQARTVEATKIALRNGFTYESELLLYALARNAANAQEIFLTGELAEQFKRQDLLVKLGKQAIANRVFAPETAFPLFTSYYKGKAKITEVPFLMAVSRQESEFNPQVVSPVGARGLMQLMPATAAETARKLGMRYDPNRLLTDPYYNATLGSHYLERQVSAFGGSYMKALAAYNAGPGRVQQWTVTYGSPLSSHIDPIDWSESIPFSETRNYVQRIMESLHVYRARMNAPTQNLTVTQDLRRGR